MNTGWRVVLQVRTPFHRECRRFGGIPVVNPAHIAVVAEDPAAAPSALDLYRRLLPTLATLAPAGASTETCDGPVGLGCMARSESTCRSLLVVVTGSGLISVALQQEMVDWSRQRPIQSSVLPILPSGADPSAVLPPPLDHMICLFNPGAIESFAPDVLRAAGVGGGDHRLFISYRRADAGDLAEQLHDAFARVGFDVFLDRFSGAPGRPFPRVLAEELADKGLILVLESPGVRHSPWTFAEVAFARALRLGLTAVTMPGGVPFQAVPNHDRVRPAPREWQASAGRGETLSATGREEVVTFIRQSYARQVLRRQLYLENLLHQSIALRGLAAIAAGGGTFRVSGGAEYVLQLASRPPRLHEVRRAAVVAAGTAPGQVAHPVVVGAHRYLPPEEGADLEWLAGQLQASLRSEARLPRMAASLAAGQVPP